MTASRLLRETGLCGGSFVSRDWWCSALLAAVVACSPHDGSGPWGFHVERRFFSSSQPQPNGVTVHTVSHRNFWISVPVGTESSDFALVASEGLEIGAGARVQLPSNGSMRWGASVASLGSTLIGERAHVGSIYSLGNGSFRVERFAASSGYIKAFPKVDQHPTARVRIGTMEGVDGSIERLSWAVSCLDSNSQRSVKERLAKYMARSPHAALRERVLVEGGRVVRFGPGHHCLRALEVMAGGTVAFDNLGGAIYLWIDASLKVAGEMRFESSSLRNVLIGYSGSNGPFITSAFRGILVCPWAQLKLPTTKRPHEGAFFAREIVVGESARIEHHSWNDTLAP